MIALLCFVLGILASPFKSKTRLKAENAALRHQLSVLRRKLHDRVRLANGDRLFFVQLYRWFPSVLNAIMIIHPRRSSVGIGLAFPATGVGSRAQLSVSTGVLRRRDRQSAPESRLHIRPILVQLRRPLNNYLKSLALPGEE
jgi:hypothetical protein